MLRSLAKSPVFTLVAVLSLAIGIGASTALFTVLDGLLFKLLPVRNPAELVRLRWSAPNGSGPNWSRGSEPIWKLPSGPMPQGEFSRATVDAFRTEAAGLAELGTFALLDKPNVAVNGHTEIAGAAQVVSGNYHRLLGVRLLRGRGIEPDDDRAEAPPVVVISHRYWQTRFQGDPAALGQTILLNRTPVTIIGITAPEFHGVLLGQPTIDLTLPVALASRLHMDVPDYAWWLCVIARLKPGVTRERLEGRLQGIFLETAKPTLQKPDEPPRFLVVPGERLRPAEIRGLIGRGLLPMLGMVALVLLAACLNVANLLLARGAARRREIAVRLALGASRARLVRQLLGESITLALLGTALGALFAHAGTALFWGGDDFGTGETFWIDGRVLAFASALAIVTGIAFGLVPAWRATRLDLVTEFQGGPRSLGSGRSRLGAALIVAQVAVSLVLVVGAGLFVRTLQNLRAVDIGFERSRLLLFSLEPESVGFAEPKQKKSGDFGPLYRRIAARVTTLPGVQAATFAEIPLLNFWGSDKLKLTVPGEEPPAGKDEGVAHNDIASDYLATFRIPLLLGRPIEERDLTFKSEMNPTVINQAFARKYFGDRNPLGRQLHLVGEWGYKATVEVVGVVGDVRQFDLRETLQPTVYQPLREMRSNAHFAVRTTRPPEAVLADVRQAVQELVPGLALRDVRTQEQAIEMSLESERRMARLATFFGAVALALAAVGLYGLLAYRVTQRTGEIGVRMALGALPGNVLRMILRESLRLVALGLVIGLGTAVIATQAIASRLYGLTATDPTTYAGVALLLVAVTLVASLLPALRAARVDPAVALRKE